MVPFLRAGEPLHVGAARSGVRPHRLDWEIRKVAG